MSKIYLIGGVDSFGVPYTRDNKEHISYFDILANYLKEKNIETIKIDMFSMSTPYNDTDYIKELLKKDITIDTIHKNQIESIDICRKSGFFQFIKLPKSTKRFYNNLNNEEKDISLRKIIKDNKVIFIYSCGANDFLKSMNTDLGKLLNPKKLKAAISKEKLSKEINLIIEKIKNNLEMLIKQNNNISIYIMSIPIPTRVRYIRKALVNPLKEYNKKLKELCDNYKQVYYIDNSNLTKKHMAHIDWHPNKEGQKQLGFNICNAISTNLNKKNES